MTTQGTSEDTRLERETGTPNSLYDVVSVLYHALKGAAAANQYAEDAEASADRELIQFFRDMVAFNRTIATRAKRTLAERLGEEYLDEEEYERDEEEDE